MTYDNMRSVFNDPTAESTAAEKASEIHYLEIREKNLFR